MGGYGFRGRRCGGMGIGWPRRRCGGGMGKSGPSGGVVAGWASPASAEVWWRDGRVRPRWRCGGGMRGVVAALGGGEAGRGHGVEGGGRVWAKRIRFWPSGDLGLESGIQVGPRSR